MLRKFCRQLTGSTEMINLPQIMTVPEAADYLKLSKSKVYNLIQTGKMPHLRIGRNVRIRQADLLKWLEIKSRSTREIERF